MSISALYLPELSVFILLALAQLHMTTWVRQRLRTSLDPIVWVITGASILLLGVGLLLNFPYLKNILSYSWWGFWLRGLGVIWGMIVAGVYVAALLCRKLPALNPEFNPQRRHLIYTVRAALLAAPVAITGYGVFIERHRFRLKEVNVPIPALPRELDGLRLVQLSDIHFSPFLTAPELETVVSMANETHPHVALVTGDLISFHGDDLETCLALLGGLKADAGVLGCLGNHEIYAGAEEYAARQGARLGIDFLRTRSRTLRFGAAALHFAGVDYQRFRRPYLVGAEKLLSTEANTVNVLLSHNPDVFPVAVNQGYDLTISGHTHGGQVNIEILNESISPARYFTKYVYGLFRDRGRAMYVTRGVGTVGVPARIAAPPEIALLRLCATSS